MNIKFRFIKEKEKKEKRVMIQSYRKNDKSFSNWILPFHASKWKW